MTVCLCLLCPEQVLPMRSSSQEFSSCVIKREEERCMERIALHEDEGYEYGVCL